MSWKQWIEAFWMEFYVGVAVPVHIYNWDFLGINSPGDWYDLGKTPSQAVVGMLRAQGIRDTARAYTPVMDYTGVADLYSDEGDEYGQSYRLR